MPIYAAGPRPATMTLAPTSRRGIKHTLDRYLPLRSSTTKQRNSADPTPQIIARIASGPVSPDSSRAQISIAPARHRPTFPDRGFLPWRLSDAGRRCTWHRRVRPASETLHRNGLQSPLQNLYLHQFTSASSFVRSPTWIFSSDRTAFLISRPNCAPTWPAASLSNLALISSQLNGRVGNPG